MGKDGVEVEILDVWSGCGRGCLEWRGDVDHYFLVRLGEKGMATCGCWNEVDCVHGRQGRLAMAWGRMACTLVVGYVVFALRTDRRRMLAVTWQSLAPKAIEKEDFKDDERGSTSVRTPRIEIKRSMLTDVDDSVLVKLVSELEE